MNKQEIIKSVVESLNMAADHFAENGFVAVMGHKRLDMAAITEGFRATAAALKAIAAEPAPTRNDDAISGERCCACGGKYQSMVMCNDEQTPVLECNCGVRWENGRLVRGPKAKGEPRAAINAEHACNLIRMAKDYLDAAALRFKSGCPAEADSCMRNAVGILESINGDSKK